MSYSLYIRELLPQDAVVTEATVVLAAIDATDPTEVNPYSAQLVQDATEIILNRGELEPEPSWIWDDSHESYVDVVVLNGGNNSYGTYRIVLPVFNL